MSASTMSARVCQGCGEPAAASGDRFCAVCGRQLELPAVAQPRSAATPMPPAMPMPPATRGPVVGWPPASSVDRGAPAGLVAAIAAAIIVAFAGVAIAIVLAVSNGDTAGSAAATGAGRTTITVISHGP